jgi:hypothetical protein
MGGRPLSFLAIIGIFVLNARFGLHSAIPGPPRRWDDDDRNA